MDNPNSMRYTLEEMELSAIGNGQKSIKNLSKGDTLNPGDGQKSIKNLSKGDTLNPGDGQKSIKKSSKGDTLNPGDQPDENPIIGVILHVVFLMTRNGKKLLARATYKITASRRSSTKSGYLKPKEIFLWALVLIPIAPSCISLVASEDINIDCRKDVSFTSPNYPSSYPNGANEKWSITAPKGRRILVTFTDFNVERDDTLYLADLVDDQSSKQYTGEGKEFPPFLAKGNELEMTFRSLESGRRRGFNVSSSCYDHSRDASLARIVGGNSPGKGFLELRTQSDDWRRVCKDGSDERVAEVVCGELGYPGVKEVSYGTDDCISARQDCIKALICNNYTFRLEDCSWSSGNCTSADAVKVECYEPGYKGCYMYDPKDLPQQNGFIFESTSQCVSSCRANSGEALAIMNGIQCSCSTTDEVNLPDIALVTCIQNRQETQRLISSLVYDVSVGFCDELDDVIHGSWGSNITWFGFTVHLTCDDGYSLNGGGTVQCVPGRSPYYPVWNGSAPTCDMSGATVGFCNQTDEVIHGSWDSNITWVGSIVNLICDDGYRLNGSGTLECVTEVSSYLHVWNGSIPTCEMIEGVSTGIGARRLALYIVPGIIFFLAICGVVICHRQRLRQMYDKWREATRTGHCSKRTTRKTRTRTSSV